MGTYYTPFDARRDATGRLYEYQCPSAALILCNGDMQEGCRLDGVRITPAQMEKVKAVLRLFEGPHDFHNFTADKCSDEGASDTMRFVSSFTCVGVRVSPTTGVEYVALQVQGDSFIYHQIRKMVGLAIFALRYVDDKSRLDFVKGVLECKSQRYVPLAPSLGLMLERVLFQKENKTHGCHTVLLDFEEVSQTMRVFKSTRIYPEIDSREASLGPTEGSFSVEHWLKFLHRTRNVWGKPFAQHAPAPGAKCRPGSVSSDLDFLFQHSRSNSAGGCLG